MEKPLYTFEPNSTEFFNLSNITLIVVVAAILLLLFLFKNNRLKSVYRQLLQMLAFFAVLIGVGLFLFNFIFGEKVGPIIIYQEKIVSPYGEIRKENIKRLNIVEDERYAPFSPQHKSPYKQLKIELKKGEVFYFSSKYYNIRAVKEAIQVRE